MASGQPGSASTGTDINLGSQNFNTSSGAFNAGTTSPTGAPINIDASGYSGNVLKAKGSDGTVATLTVANGEFNIPMGAPTFNRVTKTAAYTITTSDYAVDADTSGGGFTVTLPASPSNGDEYVITKITTDANVLTIGRNGKNLQGAAANITYAGTGRQSLTLQYDSTAGGWWIR